MKQTVAAYIAKTLESAGVKRIWGVTGDSLNGLSDSLNRMGTIEWMSTRHEEVKLAAAISRKPTHKSYSANVVTIASWFPARSKSHKCWRLPCAKRC